MLRRRTFVQGSITAGAVSTAAATATAEAADPAARPRPGDQALRWPRFTAETRPWVRWWWLGSAVTGAGLTRNLLQLHERGIGGVEVQPIYEAQGYEDRDLEYLSAEWVAALDRTTQQARRLGMQVDLTSGSGWTMGGPWISPEQSAGKVLVERWQLAEGQRLDQPVRTTQPAHPGLVDEEKLSRPDLRPPMAPLPDPPLSALVARRTDGAETLDLTGRVGADGNLDWTAPAGTWELTGVFAGLALKRVERAGPGGKGLMADYTGGTGVGPHLARLDAALGSGPRGLRASFHDSYELEATDWHRTFLADFRERRGYDVTPYLPAVLAATPAPDDTTRRALADIRQTFSELFVERFAVPWDRWSKGHGWLTRNQAHGSPANLLDVYAAADIPETEYTGGEILPIPGLRQGLGAGSVPVSLVWRMASSPAHVKGTRLVGAETITWRDEHFHVALSQAKPSVDLLFAAGVNHVLFHGSAYSPDDVPWPGFSFYAATEVQPSSTLWHDLPELTGYITRCQSVLQDGEHGNDVLVYWPQSDLWSTPTGGLEKGTELTPDYAWQGKSWMYGGPDSPATVVEPLERRGWQLDWVSDQQLQGFRARGGQLRNGRSRYAVVVVPRAERMPLTTLQHLRDLAAGGATVVFVDALPSDVPGLADLSAQQADLARLRRSMTARPVRGRKGWHRVGRGHVVVADRGRAVDAALRAAGAVREPMAGNGLRVLRRRHGGGWHYFVANLGAETVSGWQTLGVEARSVGLLDPLRDTRGRAEQRTRGGRTEVRLHLEPGQSVILRTFGRRRISGPLADLAVPTGRSRTLDGPWELTFVDGGPELPAARTMDGLVSWTELGEAEAAFSGTALYRTTVRLDADDLRSDWLLDLGRVCESARVRVNGTEVGTAWALPFRVPLGDVLRPGRNVVELEVTNLSANRFRALARRGELALPSFMSWRSGRPPQDWDPMPSGLLGPVRLVETRSPGRRG